MILLLALLFSASLYPDEDVRGWTVSDTESGCAAERTFEDGTTVTFSLDYERAESDITLWNDRWISIAKDDRYDVAVQFDAADPKVYKSHGMKTDTASGIYISADGIDTITTAMSAQDVSFRNGSQLIGRYKLDGSYKAMLAVARCIGKKVNTPTSDPFAK